MLRIFTCSAIVVAINCLSAASARAWTLPIWITPDSSQSERSRVTFDTQGNLHVFFANNRFQTGIGPDYDVYHCKTTKNGVLLTEDLRISYSHTYEPNPAVVHGSDQKHHVVWNDRLNISPTTEPGLYYARLDDEGNNIERSATLLVEGSSISSPRLLQDSDGDLNAVWLERDTLYYCKFDTSGQILIEPMLVYTNPPRDLFNVEACIDSEDRIHVTYRHYWGNFAMQFNIGYSRVTSQGVIMNEYLPLTPEIDGTYGGRALVAADDENNLYFMYWLVENYYDGYQHLVKKDPSFSTVFDIIVERISFSGQSSGEGDIALDGRGNIVMVWPLHDTGIPFRYRSAISTSDGILIAGPETIIMPEGTIIWPDLAVDSDDYTVFNFTMGVEIQPLFNINLSYFNGPPAVHIDLLPYNPPIQIPLLGGIFDYRLTITSYESESLLLDAWCDVTLPDGSTYGPLLGPVNLDLASGQVIDRDRSQAVPGYSPVGDYGYNAYLGVYPDSVYAADTFTVTVLDQGGVWIPEWNNEGEPLENHPLKPSEAEPVSDLPRLKGPFPNPFNPTTTLMYALPKARKVSLTVYDIKGREVATLINGWRDAGIQKVTFDGSELASGIYLTRLQAGDFSQTQKIILLK